MHKKLSRNFAQTKLMRNDLMQNEKRLKTPRTTPNGVKLSANCLQSNRMRVELKSQSNCNCDIRFTCSSLRWPIVGVRSSTRPADGLCLTQHANRFQWVTAGQSRRPTYFRFNFRAGCAMIVVLQTRARVNWTERQCNRHIMLEE
jgi:hypothetical protein